MKQNNNFLLKFKKYPEQQPREGRTIFYIDSSIFYNSLGIETTNVQYGWYEYDIKEEYFTGHQFLKRVKNTKKFKYIKTINIDRDEFLWCYFSDVDKLQTKMEN